VECAETSDLTLRVTACEEATQVEIEPYTVALVAMDLNPTIGTECGFAAKWLSIVAERYRVEVFVDRAHRDDVLGRFPDNVQFNFIGLDGAFVLKLKSLGLYNLVSAVFTRRVMREISARKVSSVFSAVHCITPAGVHSYNHLYQLGLPLIVGPVGGGLRDPAGFESMFGSIGLRNRLRNLFYSVLPFNPLWRRYFDRADLVLVGTDALLEILPSGVSAKSEIVFDTAVDTDIFIPLVRMPRERVSILYVGRLEVVKGCFLLLEAVRNLVRGGRFDVPFELVFYGSGSQESALRDSISRDGLKHCVTIGGQIDHQLLPRALGQADIFCLPTLREPGGGSILEAMACGLPIVTTDYGGPAYSVGDDCGFKIVPSSPEQYVCDLEAALVALIEDECLRNRMGDCSRQRALDLFSTAALRNRVFEVYERVTLG